MQRKVSLRKTMAIVVTMLVLTLGVLLKTVYGSHTLVRHSREKLKILSSALFSREQIIFNTKMCGTYYNYGILKFVTTLKLIAFDIEYNKQ